MPEPQPNQPQHITHLPNLGRPVSYDAHAQKPRDAEREAAAAHIASPDWIKPVIQLPKEMAQDPLTAAPQSRHTFTLDPVDIPVPVDAGEAPVDAPIPDAPAQSVLQRMREEAARNPLPPLPPRPVAAGYEEPEAPQYAQQPAAPQPVAPRYAPTSDTMAAAQAPRPSQHVPPPEMGNTPRTVKVPGQPVQHPVVAELLRDFGLRKADSHTFTALGRDFCIREVNSDIMSFCLGQASKLAVTEEDMGARTRLMVAALSVVAINGTPLSELLPWNRAAIKRGQKFDPWWPPFPVVTLLAESVFRLFFEDMKINVIAKIAEEYDAVYGDDTEPEDATRTPLAVAKEDSRIRFKCSVAGCGHVLDAEPVFVGPDTIKSIFCPEHGVALTPIGYVRELTDIPLA